MKNEQQSQPTMTKTAAIKQARSECEVYGAGASWTLSTYCEIMHMHRHGSYGTYAKAMSAKSQFLIDRANSLLCVEENAYYEGGNWTDYVCAR